MNDTKKGNTVLLTVIAVATLLVAVVGATFAYFTASVSNPGGNESVVVTTANLGTITYQNGTQISLDNALPGASDTKSFTIKLDESGTNDLKYTIKWKSVDNTFEGTDLVYTLQGNGSNGNTGIVGSEGGLKDYTAPTTGNNIIIGTGTIKPGETHTYNLTLKFKETGSDQNSNQGKKFSGEIEVTTSDESGNSLYYNNENSAGTSTMPSSEEE